MSPQDLTTLALVKAWQTTEGTSSDTLLATLITAWSRAILTYISKSSVLSQQYSDRYDGLGGGRIMLRNWPVSSIISLAIGGTSIVAANPNSPSPIGYLLDPWDGTPPGRMQSLDVFGSCVPRGRQNVSVVYVGGYLVQGEAAVVPATPFQITAAAAMGPWAADGGVTYANGTPLAKVASAPSVGQYSVASGVYTFAAADVGASMLINYSFIPADISQCATALVAEDNSYRSRIGQISKSLGGQETISYSQANIPARYKTILDQYRNVVPF